MFVSIFVMMLLSGSFFFNCFGEKISHLLGSLGPSSFLVIREKNQFLLHMG